MLSNIQKAFLKLVRLGIGHHGGACPDAVDLAEVKGLAEKQGLSAVVLDGVDKWRTVENSKEGSKNVSLQEKIFLAEWIGEVHQFYELRYEQYLQTIAQMAAFYNEHGFKMMVLKGYACSLDWPKPNHRPCGDIDLWQFGEQKEADEALTAWFKGSNVQEFKVDNSHHHHTIFTWGDFMVENHYDFIDVHHRKSGRKLETIFKELGKDDTYSVEVMDASTGSATKVYLPSPNLHALFLVYHTMLHFTSTEMSIRQILDWGLFVKAHTSEVDWDWLWEKVNEFHLSEFLNIINGICVEDLGFEADIFHGVQFNTEMKKRVMNDTLNPEFEGQEPREFLRRIWFRYRRWKSHEWKHKLCFEESMWNIFWTAVWSHMLKPGSI